MFVRQTRYRCQYCLVTRLFAPPPLRTHSLMDKVSDYKSERPGFEPREQHFYVFFKGQLTSFRQ